MSINAPQKMGYTIRQKIDICLMAESNPKMTQTDLANWAKKKYHTIRPPSQTTISRILSKKNDLIALKEHEYRLIRRRKSSNLLLREILTEWLYQAIWLNSTISVNNIQLAAVDLWKLLPDVLKQGNGQFSHKWCINFLSKLNISQSSLSKNLYKPVKIWDLATERIALKKFLGNNFKLNDIFYLDEFNLFYKIPLDYHYTSSANTFNNKNSITILLTANADGSEKLEPFIVAHYDNMISFQGKPLSKITSKYQIAYKSNKQATMTASLFVDWLSILDKRLSLIGRHIVLILDDCSAHRVANIKLDFIQLVFVRNPNHPSLVFSKNRSKEFENTTESVTVPNSTSSPMTNFNNNVKFSPMHLGIFKEFKTLYRLQQYILAISLQMKLSSSNGNTCQYLHSKHYSLSMSDVLIMIKNAWANVSVEIIKEAFIASDLLDFELYVQQQFDLLTSSNPGDSSINNNNNNDENIFGAAGSGTTSNDSTIITSLSNSSESPLLLLNNHPEDSINFNNNANEGRIWGNTYPSNNTSSNDVSPNKALGSDAANNTNLDSVSGIPPTGNSDNGKNNSSASLNNSNNSGGNTQQHHHGLMSNTAIDFKNSESKLVQMMSQFKTFPSQNDGEYKIQSENSSPSAINNTGTGSIVRSSNGNAWKLEHLLNLPQEEKLLNYESLRQMIQCCVVDEYEPKEKLPDTPENLVTNSSVQTTVNNISKISKADSNFSKVDNTNENNTIMVDSDRFNIQNSSNFNNDSNKNTAIKEEELTQPSLDMIMKGNIGNNGGSLNILDDIDLMNATGNNKKNNMSNNEANNASQASMQCFDPFSTNSSGSVNNGNVDSGYGFMNENSNSGNKDMNSLDDMNFNGININGTLSSNLGNLGFGIPNNNNGFNNSNEDSNNNNNFLFSASIPSAEEMVQMYNNVGNTYNKNDDNGNRALNALIAEQDKNNENNDANRGRQNNLIYNQHVNRYTANPLYSEPVKKGNLTSIVTIPDNAHSFGELYRKKRKLDSATNKDESGNSNEADNKKDNSDSRNKSLFGYGNTAFGMSVSDSGSISLSSVANSPAAQQNSPLPQPKSGNSITNNSSGTFQDLRQSASKRANILSTVISAAQSGVFKLSAACIDELTNEFYNQLSFVENESIVHDARASSGQQSQLQMLIEGLEIGSSSNNPNSNNIGAASGKANV